MSKVFVIGAAGKVGRRLCQQLSARGHQVLGLYRRPEQGEELKRLGATPMAGNLLELEVSELADLMSGSDAVVFTAGAGGAGVELTNAIDGHGLELAVTAAKSGGIHRFILVSVFPDARRNQSTSEGFENYMAVKKRADVYLVESDLDWIIVRPGRLLEDRGTGKVRADLALPYGDIPRDDVAATLVELIEQPAASKIIIELTSGDTPIADAVRRLARG